MQAFLNAIFGIHPEIDDVPMCPDHKVEMRLRGKMGRPARFSDTIEQQYTLIFFCPVAGCNNTATSQQVRAQVPGEGTPRPDYSRVQDRRRYESGS